MSEVETQLRPKVFKIILFAQQVLIREALQILIESKDNFKIVASTGDSLALRGLTKEHNPNLILLYLLNGDAKSVEIIPELQKSVSEPYVLAITKSSDASIQHRALHLGAIKAISVENEASQLLETISQICSGKVLPDLKPPLPSFSKNKLLASEKRFDNPNDHNEYKIKTLTQREREIVGMVGEGLRSKEVAARLNISKTTVRHHLSSVYDKLELKDKLNLVIFAHRHKLLKPFEDKE